MVDRLFGAPRSSGVDQEALRAQKAQERLQAERIRTATKSEAEADQKLGLVARGSSLRSALAYRDNKRSSSLGG